MQFVWCAFVAVSCLIGVDAKWVIEGDSSIIREIQDNPSVGYLIKFHAPWCGHCKHFEPVYEEVARAVNDPALADDELQNIRIVRIDATVHSNVANYYDIRGYPTVKFIRNAQIYSYENERTKPAILNFLRRVNGPALRWISSVEQYEALRREHEVFFLLVGETAEDDLLMKEYNDVVHRYLSQAYFYATNASTIRERYFSDRQADDSAQVFAVKNEEVFVYQPEVYGNSLDEFVLKEKVATFPQIAAGNIYELILTKRILIIYGFDERKKDAEPFQRRTAVKDQLRDFVTQHASSLHDTFQFAWSNDLELLSNIALWKIDEPLLFLYDSNQRRYGVHPLLAVVDGHAQLEPVLNHVVSNYSAIIQHAGNTWWKRLLRPFWELSRTLMAMFVEAPLMSMFVVGVPASVLSIVCYCICCLPNETMMDEELEMASRQTKDDDGSSGDDDDEAETPKTMSEKKEE